MSVGYMLHICFLQVSQCFSSLFCRMHFWIVLIVFWLPLGTNSKHVDLKLKKLVDVSPRSVTSPSSPSSSSSSPTASSASPVSPTEGQEVYPHSGHAYFAQWFPFFPPLSFYPSLFYVYLSVFSRHHQRVIGSIRSDCPCFSVEWPGVRISQLNHFM